MTPFKKPGRAGVGKFNLTDLAILAAQVTATFGLCAVVRLLAG